MTDVFTYTKKRNEIGLPPNYTNSRTIMKIGLLPEEETSNLKKQNTEEALVRKNPNTITLGNFAKLSENIVNTERVQSEDVVIAHYQGGWPKNVDITDSNECRKHIKKNLEKNAENQDKFTPAVRKMLEVVEKVISQNNEIDMFEEYFEDEEPEYTHQQLNVKTLKLFKNVEVETKRCVSSLSWHPDGPYKIAASYSMQKFQPDQLSFDYSSYIWDITNPNTPCDIIKPNSPITKLVYNHKNVEQLSFGCYNGVVGLWDLRQNRHQPALVSEVEISHHEPVFDLVWLSSKGGNEFVSCSTDGRVIWWDYRDLSKHSDSLIISENNQTDNSVNKIFGTTCLEYVADYGVSQQAQISYGN